MTGRSGTGDAVRDALLGLYAAALHAVDGRRCVADALTATPPSGAVHVIAIGKAAAAMLGGARDALGTRLASALLVTKHGHDDPWLACDPRVRSLTAGHPTPDAASFAAGEALSEYVRALPADATVRVLLSGGASSLVEAAVPGFGPDDIARATAYALGAGWDIGALNRLRRRWSRLKAGGLAEWLAPRPVEVLLISDVPGDDPALIGSGPLWPSPDTALPPLPDWLGARLPAARTRHGTPPPHRILASNRDACEAARRAAEARGWRARTDERGLQGDAVAAADRVAEALLAADAGCHIWGGETTVRLPEPAGQGGRNQHFALALAARIAGRNDIVVLAAGTDGTDGPGSDAGALVDGGTVARGRDAGLDVAACLRGADSGRFLAASGDLLHTGPTGTNVMDLVIALKRGGADRG